MLLHKSIEHDSRVRRAARALADAGHEVTVLHLPRERGELDGELDGFEVRSVTPAGRLARRLPRPLRRALSIREFVRALRELRPAAIHAHDAAMLVPGWLGAQTTGALLIYDSHELATGVPYRDWLWARLVAAIERLLAPRCDLVITVSDGIAERLAERYPLRRQPVVVRNFPDMRAYEVDDDGRDLREELGIDKDTPLVLHLGAAALDRGCEALVGSIASFEDRPHLLFLGVDAEYARRLGALATRRGVAERVHFLPSVPVRRVLAQARQADVGASLLEDTCENHRLALPNKVFEYLAAGVPVVASDLPELRRTLAGQQAAHLADPTDESSVAAALRAAIDGERPVTPSKFDWGGEEPKLIAAYAELEPGARRERKRAVVLVRNAVDHDARIQREAGLLDSLGFETTIVGVAAGSARAANGRVAGARLVRLDPGSGLRRLLGRTGRTGGQDGAERASPAPVASAAAAGSRPGAGARLRRLVVTADFYRRGLRLVLRTRPRLIHANDYNTAWIGVLGKWLTGARLIYDSHELWPDRNLRPEPRPWLLLCEALFVRAADEVITTSPGYAEVLSRRYRIPTPRVVRNVVDWRLDAAPNRPSESEPLAVYFGAITRNRGLATALRAVALVPELRMRFVGPEAWGYRAELRALAEQLGVADRLELLDPVPPERAADVLADADIGLALIEPACLSYEMTLPNKLYEYVAAGLPVLSSEVQVLAAEVRENRIGLVADPSDPAAVAAALRSLLEPEANARCRAEAQRLAAETVWERERQGLVAAYAAALSA